MGNVKRVSPAIGFLTVHYCMGNCGISCDESMIEARHFCIVALTLRQKQRLIDPCARRHFEGMGLTTFYLYGLMMCDVYLVFNSQGLEVPGSKRLHICGKPADMNTMTKL